MKIVLHPTYAKHYHKRISSKTNLSNKTIERIKLFQHDLHHPLLKDHALAGTHFGHRGFWITGDIRIVYRWTGKNKVRFLAIGDHKKVYGKKD